MNDVTFSELCKVIDLTADTMDNYMYVADFINDRYHISKQALSRFAVPSETFYDVVKTHELFVYGPDYDTLKAELEELSNSDRVTHNMQYRWVSKEGTPIWINCRGTVIRIDGKPAYLVGCVNEIGAKPKADNQSGLLRLGGEGSLPKKIATEEFTGFVLRIGIDDLRGVNARVGSAVGDSVIANTAECILGEISDEQYVYHIAGDEFIVLSPTDGNINDAIDLYHRIRKSIIRKIRANGFKVVYTISGGIVLADDLTEKTFESVMKSSEFALFMAKDWGKNTYARFDQELYLKHIGQHDLEKILQDSVNKNFEGFDANYQILFSQEKGIIGAETLMRYTAPDGRIIPPSEFVPILEASGLIIPAGRWILEKATNTCKKIKEYIPDFFITVNISYVQISRTDIAGEIEAALKKANLDPNSLVIELTESGMIESDMHFASNWNRLKDMGVRLALDDFGTGYSNFRYLNELRPDILKIDRSFTVSALKDEYEFTLLHNMRKLAKNLSLNMCVEGVETKEELDRINEIEPEYIQGFYFGRPSSLEDLIIRVQM